MPKTQTPKADKNKLKGIPDDIEGVRGVVVDTIPNWFYAVISPFSTCDRILKADGAQSNLAFALWFEAFIVSWAINVVLFQFLNVKWDTKTFWVILAICETFGILLLGFVMHLGLSFRGVRCRSSDLIGMYIAFIALYQPLGGLLSFWSEGKHLQALGAARKLGLGFPDTIAYISVNSGVSGGLELLTTILFFTFFSFGSTLIALEISKRYNLDRVKCLSAMAVVVALVIAPIYLATELGTLFVTYAFWR